MHVLPILTCSLGEIVSSVLKTTVQAMAALNIQKNLVGSAMAGSIGTDEWASLSNQSDRHDTYIATSLCVCALQEDSTLMLPT